MGALHKIAPIHKAVYQPRHKGVVGPKAVDRLIVRRGEQMLFSFTLAAKDRFVVEADKNTLYALLMQGFHGGEFVGLAANRLTPLNL